MQTEKSKKRRPFWHYFIVAVLALCVCSGIASVTYKPAPVSTAVPPAPASTLAALAPTATVDQREAVYAQTTGDRLTRWGTAMTRFGALNSAPKLGDASWGIDVGVELAAIDTVNQEIGAAQAPGKFGVVDALLKNAAQHFAKFTRLYRQGMDSSSVDTLNSARYELELGNSQIQEATKMLGTIAH